MTSIYSTGTVSVTNGNAVVTGSGTAWAVALIAGGMFSSAGVSVPVASVDSDTSLTLAYDWPGTTATGAVYAIARENSEAADIVDLNDKLSRVLVTLSLVGITPDASGTLMERDALTLAVGDKGFLFLHAELGYDFEFYRWSGSAWDGPFATRGPAGLGTGGTIEGLVHAATSKATLVDADEMALVDSAASFGLKKLTWANLKATLKSNLALREVLTANRTYYVRSDGSDSNTGLVDNAGGAFATKQKAINVASMLDLSTFNVTINVRAGADSSGGISVNGPWIGLGSVTITGDTTTPSNVPIARTSANCVTLTNGARLNMGGFKFSTTTSGTGISVDSNSILTLNGKFEIGACATYHMFATGGGAIAITADYTISGGALYHWLSSTNGRITCVQRTITLTGTPAFSSQFTYASRTGVVEVHLNTFSGSATGIRYYADGNGVIFTNGAGASYLPGSVAGTTPTTGGQYA